MVHQMKNGMSGFRRSRMGGGLKGREWACRNGFVRCACRNDELGCDVDGRVERWRSVKRNMALDVELTDVEKAVAKRQ
jgi:hypothetical protein